MPSRSARRPSFDPLESRLAMSATAAAHFAADASYSGALADGRAATLADLQAFTAAYPSVRGQPNFNPEVDVNGNGRVGLVDGRLLVQHSPPLTPEIRLSLDVNLAPADEVHGPRPKNSGGVTRRAEVTVLGHTTPGALIFRDDAAADFKFTGPAYVADRRGFFSFRQVVPVGVTTDNFLVFDQFGRQTIRAFPILALQSPRNPGPPPRPL